MKKTDSMVCYIRKLVDKDKKSVANVANEGKKINIYGFDGI